MKNIIEKHNPLMAYKINKASFLERDYFVDKRVYIPNPETELMVLKAIKYIKDKKLQNGTFVDVGTGCGNIAISLAKAFPKANIIATDTSKEALKVAKINIKNHKANIRLVHTDLVEKVLATPDLVIGNLPWGDDDHLLQTNKKEWLEVMPEIAIFAPDGIIGTYVRLIEQIRSKKWKTVLFTEVGLLSEELVSKNLPNGLTWEYIKIKHQLFNYSVVKIDFKELTLHHNHLIYQASTGKLGPEVLTDEKLVQFLYDLVDEIKMKVLIHPQVKLSHHNAWTGFIGIVTSHISFHYWTNTKLLQLDIYSCGKLDVDKAINFIDGFWNVVTRKGLFIKRDSDKEFDITNI